jgi:methionyl-tRNA formyltransferase
MNPPTKVVFLSAGPLGPIMLRYLQSLPGQEVIYSNIDGKGPSAVGPFVPVFNISAYDLGINFLGTSKIPESELELPKRWCNFHPAPLPEFRGRNLAYQAIMEGAREFGASLHWMDNDYDTGDLIEVRRFPIMPWHTAGDLVRESHRLLCVMFREWIPGLLRGTMQGKKQSTTGGRYFKKTPIDDRIELTPLQEVKIKALTVSQNGHFPYAVIGGRKWKLVPEDM